MCTSIWMLGIWNTPANPHTLCAKDMWMSRASTNREFFARILLLLHAVNSTGYTSRFLFSFWAVVIRGAGYTRQNTVFQRSTMNNKKGVVATMHWCEKPAPCAKWGSKVTMLLTSVEGEKRSFCALRPEVRHCTRGERTPAPLLHFVVVTKFYSEAVYG